jgi:5'-3' exonuclease
MIRGLNMARLTGATSPREGGRSTSHLGVTLLIDVTCLCYRSLFASIAERSQVEPDQIQSFVLERFFLSLQTLSELFRAKRYVFCFDDGKSSLRREAYPAYKHVRKERVKTDEELHAIRETGRVISMLRDGGLSTVGFGNVCWQQGLEADDIMAWCALNFDHSRMVMVTDDADMFQCLRSHVSQWRPCKGRTYTLADYFADHDNITPQQWAEVKSIAGCKSDNVEGIRGIGEVTAIRFLNGTMPQKGTKWAAITSVDGLTTIQCNRHLVTLPHPATNPIEYKPDAIDVDALMRLFAKYGLRILMEEPQDWKTLTS